MDWSALIETLQWAVLIFVAGRVMQLEIREEKRRD